MSEKWVLVPPVITDEMFDAGFDGSDHQESWANMLAARPPVPPEWLDAAVERGAKALATEQKQPRVYSWHRTDARTAILAALEITDG